MMSLSHFRRDLFKFFKMMKDDKMVVEVSWHRRIYRIWVEGTDRKVETPYQLRRKRKADPVLNSLIVDETCPDCGGLMISGVCFKAHQ